MKNKYRALAITSAMIMAFTTAPMTAFAEPDGIILPSDGTVIDIPDEGDGIILPDDGTVIDIPEEGEGTVVIDGDEEKASHPIDIMFNGADKVIVTRDIVTGDFYQIPENGTNVKKDCEFIGYYCPQTGKTYQTGDYIAIADATAFTDELGYVSYQITLNAMFKEIQVEQPDVVYTDKAIYRYSVNIVSPDNYDSSIGVIDGSTENLNAIVDTVMPPRTLTRGYYRKYELDGFLSLVTGKFFAPNEAFSAADLPAPEEGEMYLQEVSETEGFRITPYTVQDALVPIFNFYGVTGAYQDITVDCEIDYYRAEDFTNAADLNAPSVYMNTENVTVAMAEEADGILLTAPEEVPGYIFTGYGPLDGTEAIFTDGIVYLEDCVEWSSGELRFAVKAFYEIDENYVPEVDPADPEEPQEEPEQPETKEYKNLGQEIKALNHALKGEKEALKEAKNLAKETYKAKNVKVKK